MGAMSPEACRVILAVNKYLLTVASHWISSTYISRKTVFMEHSHWKGNSLSADKCIPQLSWNPKFTTMSKTSVQWTLSWSRRINSKSLHSIYLITSWLSLIVQLQYYSEFSLKRNLGKMENFYGPKDLQSRESKLQVPVGNGTC